VTTPVTTMSRSPNGRRACSALDEAHDFAERLPLSASQPAAEIIQLDGFLLKGSTDQFAIVMGSLCLEFERGDLLAVSELVDVDLPSDSYVLPVRVQLRTGARLKHISSSEPYLPLIYGQTRPFAMAARPDARGLPPSKRYRDREREFLARHGIDPGQL
jgi:hypothetical protein